MAKDTIQAIRYSFGKLTISLDVAFGNHATQLRKPPGTWGNAPLQVQRSFMVRSVVECCVERLTHGGVLSEHPVEQDLGSDVRHGSRCSARKPERL